MFWKVIVIYFFNLKRTFYLRAQPGVTTIFNSMFHVENRCSAGQLKIYLQIVCSI